MSFFGRFLGTNETHDVFAYASVNDRVDDQVLEAIDRCPEGYQKVAGTTLDDSAVYAGGYPRAVINVSGRGDWTDEIAHTVAHELSHAGYDWLRWAQTHPVELAALDLSRDRTHDTDQGLLPS